MTMQSQAGSTIFVSISIGGISFIMALLINAFIVGVNLTDWWRGRQIKAADTILFSVSFSRMVFQSFSFFDVCSQTILQFSLNSIIAVGFFEVLSFYSSLWFVTLLSVFYFLKIANHRHRLFLYLKMMISQRVLNFIAVAVLLAFCNTLLNAWSVNGELTEGNSTLDMSINKTHNNRRRYTFTITFILGNCAPFIIYNAAFILLVNSLYHHMKQMRNMGNGFTSNHLKSYYVAIKTLATCFLIYGLHISCNLFFIFSDSVIHQIWIRNVTSTFPSLHSAYLIYLTPKLRQRFSTMLPCRIRRGDTGPNSDGHLETIA